MGGAIDQVVDARMDGAISILVKWPWTLLRAWVWLLVLSSHNRGLEGFLLPSSPRVDCADVMSVECWPTAIDDIVNGLVLPDILLNRTIVHLTSLDSLTDVPNQDAARPISLLGFRTIKVRD